MSSPVKFKYLKFTTQKDAVCTEAINFATLKSGGSSLSLTKRFTICGSIYIGYFRGYQSFYTVRKTGQKTLWLSLSLYSQQVSEETYLPAIFYFDSSILPNTGGKLRLRPHGWSHACTTLDTESGHILVVINGLLTHNATIRSKDFTDDVPASFNTNLVLGIFQMKYAGAPDNIQQSEASVANINVFSEPKSISEMVQITTMGQRTDGNIIAWSKATWSFTGQVEEVNDDDDTLQPSQFGHLYKMPGIISSWSECIGLCQSVQPDGRVPLTLNLSETRYLSQKLGKPDSKDWFWSSYGYSTEGDFIDYYTGTSLPAILWKPGQPNGGKSQQCSSWQGSSRDGKLFDEICNYEGEQVYCPCSFKNIPILRLRGLCKGSNINTHYSLKSIDDRVIYMGLTDTNIGFEQNQSKFKWTLTNIQGGTMGTTSAEHKSSILGQHTWKISNDSQNCFDGETYTTELKMSGCNRDQFTCRNGQCVGMEERCDQVLDCTDESDEVGCKTVLLKTSYRKTAPPVTLQRKEGVRSVKPATVKVSVTLLDIVGIREAENKIYLKFSTELEWNETRALYHNLKRNVSQNTLETSDIDLWIPKLVYRNNNNNEDTRSEIRQSTIFVVRKGSFSRSKLETLDEVNIFKGEENPIVMIQSYTKEFSCKYNLQVFPFDTQVTI